MVRPPRVDSNGMKKGAWSEEEDKKLRAYVLRYGHWNWRLLPKYAGLARCGKSCRLRWVNYLKPGIKRGNFTKDEEDLILQLHAQLGNKWSAIAAKLPGRTDNEIKNFWHTRVQKRSSSAQNVKRINASESSSMAHQVSDKEKPLQANSPIKLEPQDSKPSFDTNPSESVIPETKRDSFVDVFLPDTTYAQMDSFPGLLEEDYNFHSELQYSDLSLADSSSYPGALEWTGDEDHSMMFSDFRTESFALDASSKSLSQSGCFLPQDQDLGGLYDPLNFHRYFDHDINLFR